MTDDLLSSCDSRNDNARCHTSILDARQRIDQEIDTLLEQVRSLRERRNRLAPISVLPAEILSLIFLYCTPYLHTDRQFPKTRSKESTLRTTTRILRSNRTLRLPEADVTAVLAHLPRTKMLHLHALPSTFFLNAQYLSRRAPLLVDCSLSASGDLVGLLPETFLGRFAPHLQRLAINNVALEWETLCSPSVVQSLTSLEIRMPGDILPNGRCLVDALALMPLLQILKIAD
ncbi:hypothetical protein PUNSTDRAFT_58374, partial [Punctularia strigosozonata HHB-11173 SS5]|uniref:uncharacterized protein n=1 Tax=Punctularia strigosozonata (strain HHB-11173) TaxID=741275 RepID=UPI00044186EE